MVKSMTGCGRGDFSIGTEFFFVEVRSLNHRFLDIKVKLPDRFFDMESLMKEELKKRFSRGAFSLFLYSGGMEAPEIKLNVDAAKAYLEAAGELKKTLGVKGELDVGLLLGLRDVFSPLKKEIELEAAWGHVRKALSSALDQVEEWRVKEGNAIEKDLRGRVSSIEGFMKRIESKVPGVLASYRQKLKEDIERMVGERVEESRIVLEAAIFAERSDISEEITRLKSHVEFFKSYLEAREPVGKRLDFLCQEILREVNTIASKSQDAEITHAAVEMKGELEKIREQVQNVE